MKLLGFLLLACVTAESKGCIKAIENRPELIINPISPHIPKAQLPKTLDYRNINNTNYCTQSHSQFVPKACGSCWAFAATGALSDRIKIATRSLFPDINLSPQVLLNTQEFMDMGSCDGGNAVLAYKYMNTHGITDNTCIPYEGVDHSFWGESPDVDRFCRACDRFGVCNFTTPATIFKVSEYGSIQGEEAMMNEIYQRGPIACSLYAHSESFEDYTGGIIRDATHYNDTTHVVSIIGWGETEDSSVQYWIGRNSFGTSWGEGYGFFRIERGRNTLNIESHFCGWAVPSPETVSEVMAHNTVKNTYNAFSNSNSQTKANK